MQCKPSADCMRLLVITANVTYMPAALPAATPLGASSKTRHVEDSAFGSNLSAAYRKMSGAGLPFVIKSPALH